MIIVLINIQEIHLKQFVGHLVLDSME